MLCGGSSGLLGPLKVQMSPDFRSDGCRLLDRSPLGSGIHSHDLVTDWTLPLKENDVSVEPECAIVVRCSAHAAFPEALAHVASSTKILGSLEGWRGMSIG